MCIVIVKSEGAEFDPSLFKNCYEHNQHGWGIMLFGKTSDKDGRRSVNVRKGMFDLDQINQIYDEYKDRTLVMHFRSATKGEKITENCHPFQILNRKEHGQDLFMMHNGTLREVEIKDIKYSDTFHFCEDYLKPLMIKDPLILEKEAFRDLLGMGIGNPNKLIFMSSLGKITIVNREQGHDLKEGVWVSNQYSLKEKVKSTTTVYHGNSNSQWNIQTHSYDHVAQIQEPLVPKKAPSNFKDNPNYFYDETLGLYCPKKAGTKEPIELPEDQREIVTEQDKPQIDLLTPQQRKYMSISGTLPPNDKVVLVTDPTRLVAREASRSSNGWKHRRSQSRAQPRAKPRRLSSRVAVDRPSEVIYEDGMGVRTFGEDSIQLNAIMERLS